MEAYFRENQPQIKMEKVLLKYENVGLKQFDAVLPYQPCQVGPRWALGGNVGFR